jgi:protein-tyrosine phosphatase
MKILLVCLGNICRSPMAEGVLRQLAKEKGIDLEIDSAGTNRYHTGEAPDPRAQAAMKRYGSDIGELRARTIEPADFERFDLLLVMDTSNLKEVRKLAPREHLKDKVRLLMDYAPGFGATEVPDPYYGGDEGFDEVYRMLIAACEGVLEDVRSTK